MPKNRRCRIFRRNNGIGKGLLPSSMHLYVSKMSIHWGSISVYQLHYLLNFVISRVCHQHIISAVFCLADQWRRRAITVHWLFISWDCCAMHDVLTVEQALQHPAVKIISVSNPNMTGFEKRGHFNHVFFERTHVFKLAAIHPNLVPWV